METTSYMLAVMSLAASRGAETPKGNGDGVYGSLVFFVGDLEPGGRNAERQWRLRACLWSSLSIMSRGAETPKGNGDHIHALSAIVR